MEKFKGVIYQAINIQNKKSYIGKTIQDFNEYQKIHIDNAIYFRDLQNGKGKYFYNAIRKYGPQNFKWVILGEIIVNCKEDLNKKLNEAEIESIWLFRTFGSDGEKEDGIYGYNRTKGGDGFQGKGERNSMYGKNYQCYTPGGLVDISHTKKGKTNIEIYGEEKALAIKLKLLNTLKEKPPRPELHSKPGTSNSRYKKVDIIFILRGYFNSKSKKEIANSYNLYHDISISVSIVKRILKVLNLPSGGAAYYHKKQKEKEKFIEENKDKIDWYIENYERLEQEYFENKQKRKE